MPVENFTIRKIYDEKTHKWFFSIVDTIENTVSTTDARNYWKVLKNRLKKGDNQLVTRCNQLKLLSSDGKWYLTDTADSQTIMEIVSLVSPESLPDIKSFLAKVELKNAPFEVKIDHPASNSFPQQNVSDYENELSVDVKESPSQFIVKAFVAGVDPNNVTISLTSNTLSIKGARVPAQQSNNNYIHQELFWGSFYRTIELPAEVEIDTVQAVESRGLLTITLQKVDLLRTRPLKIKSLQ